MKIIPKIKLKIGGIDYLPGKIVDVPKEIADRLIRGMLAKKPDKKK